MKIAFLFIIMISLQACVGVAGIKGNRFHTYTVESKSTIRLQAESTNPYSYEITNTSLEELTLKVKTSTGKTINLNKDEHIKVEMESLEGIEIENNSGKEGLLLLRVFLHNQKLTMPKAVLLSKK